MVFSNKNNISYYIKISICIKILLELGLGFGAQVGLTRPNPMKWEIGDQFLTIEPRNCLYLTLSLWQKLWQKSKEHFARRFSSKFHPNFVLLFMTGIKNSLVKQLIWILGISKNNLKLLFDEYIFPHPTNHSLRYFYFLYFKKWLPFSMWNMLSIFLYYFLLLKCSLF